MLASCGHDATKPNQVSCWVGVGRRRVGAHRTRHTGRDEARHKQVRAMMEGRFQLGLLFLLLSILIPTRTVTCALCKLAVAAC